LELEGVLAIAEAIKFNVMPETMDLKDNTSFGLRSRIMETIYLWRNEYISYGHLTFEIAETLKENHPRKEKNYCKFICAFTAYQADSVRLRFDKMMLRFVYYPILGWESLRFEEY
jgi:hypothetical protein